MVVFVLPFPPKLHNRDVGTHYGKHSETLLGLELQIVGDPYNEALRSLRHQTIQFRNKRRSMIGQIGAYVLRRTNAARSTLLSEAAVELMLLCSCRTSLSVISRIE